MFFVVALTFGYAMLGRGYKVGALGLAAVAVTATTVMRWRSGRPGGPASLAGWLPALIPLSLSFVIDLQPHIVEVVLPDPDRRWRIGFGLLVMGLLAGGLILLGVDVRRGIDRSVHWFSSGLRVVVASLILFVVLLPLGIARLWSRGDPLGTGEGSEGTAWHKVVVADDRLTRRTYRSERVRSTGRTGLVEGLGRAIGLVALLLAADLAVGAAWERIAPRGGTRVTSAPSRIEVVTGQITAPPVDLADPSAEPLPADPREDLPAMAAYPWRHEYFQELQRAPSTYWPYLLWRPLPAFGRYINITDSWERIGYQSPRSTDADVPTVDFFGGSTIYGEGQRDEHTISSEVARLAEADGLMIRARNRGVRGWVNWQEMLLFEQLSADEATRPDLALFYDGANEFDAQGHGITGVPAHTVLDEIATRMAGPSAVTSSAPRVVDDPDLRPHLELIVEDYVEASALVRAGRWVRDAVVGIPADARAATPTGPGQSVYVEGGPVVRDIYQRGQALIADIADRRGVDVLFFWQPLQAAGWEQYREGIEDPTIDLSRVLEDHSDTFIDGTHHNEEAAAIVAASIWEHLKPRVEVWYASR